MSESISYSKVTNVDIKSAMASSQKSLDASRKLRKADSDVWNQTVCVVMNNMQFTPEHRENLETTRDHLYAFMGNYLETTCDIPKEGKDRDGKTIELRKKDGSIKWSSWEETRRIFAYLGDIAKIIVFSQEDKLYPETNKVGSRIDVLNLCKTPKTPLENIKRVAVDAQVYATKITTPKDSMEAYEALQAIKVEGLDIEVEMNAVINRLDALLSCAEPEQKDRVKSVLLKVATKYFK